MAGTSCGGSCGGLLMLAQASASAGVLVETLLEALAARGGTAP